MAATILARGLCLIQSKLFEWCFSDFQPRYCPNVPTIHGIFDDSFSTVLSIYTEDELMYFCNVFDTGDFPLLIPLNNNTQDSLDA